MLELFSTKRRNIVPNIKSAKKRVLVSERRKTENKFVKATIATYVKNFKAAVKENIEEAEKMLPEIITYIDSAETKGVIHKKNASRKIARLNTYLFKAKNPTAAVATAAEVEAAKEEIKQEIAEEKPAKKTAAKKATAKKESK